MLNWRAHQTVTNERDRGTDRIARRRIGHADPVAG